MAPATVARAHRRRRANPQKGQRERQDQQHSEVLVERLPKAIVLEHQQVGGEHERHGDGRGHDDAAWQADEQKAMQQHGGGYGHRGVEDDEGDRTAERPGHEIAEQADDEGGHRRRLLEHEPGARRGIGGRLFA
jgi:hypothetical protein